MNLRNIWIVFLGLSLVVSVMGFSEALGEGVLHSEHEVASGEIFSVVDFHIGEVLSAMMRPLVRQSPVFLVSLLGAVIAIARWPRHPGVSALVISAVSISTLTSLTCAFISAVSLQVMATWEPAIVMWVYEVIWFCSFVMYAVAWGLMLAAAFCWRKPGIEHAKAADVTEDGLRRSYGGGQGEAEG